MKQHSRIFRQPGKFFNQLQWSPNHWPIVFAFMLVATVETVFGGYQTSLAFYSNFIQQYMGLSPDVALWSVMTGKIILMISTVYVISFLVWLIGSFLGDEGSARVLFRRLAVVFTVMLLGYTASHLSSQYPTLVYASLGLYIWGGFLGFHAIKEQFELGVVETVIVSAFTIVLVASTWKYSDHAMKELATNHIVSQTNTVQTKKRSNKAVSRRR